MLKSVHFGVDSIQRFCEQPNVTCQILLWATPYILALWHRLLL